MTQTPASTPNDGECVRFEEQLMAYLERDLDVRGQHWMRQHQLSCGRCRQLAHELESTTRAAATLPTMAPSHDLWPGIASRLETSVLPLYENPGDSAFARISGPGRGGLLVRHLAIAATLLVTVSSAITWRLVRPTTEPTIVVATKRDSVVDLMTIVPVANADVTYEREIAALRAIVTERMSELDSTTVATLVRNLAIIDQAIADSREALEKAPGSRVLSGTLDRALRSKLSLMRRVALL